MQEVLAFRMVRGRSNLSINSSSNNRVISSYPIISNSSRYTKITNSNKCIIIKVKVTTTSSSCNNNTTKVSNNNRSSNNTISISSSSNSMLMFCRLKLHILNIITNHTTITGKNSKTITNSKTNQPIISIISSNNNNSNSNILLKLIINNRIISSNNRHKHNKIKINTKDILKDSRCNKLFNSRVLIKVENSSSNSSSSSHIIRTSLSIIIQNSSNISQLMSSNSLEDIKWAMITSYNLKAIFLTVDRNTTTPTLVKASENEHLVAFQKARQFQTFKLDNVNQVNNT